MYYDISIPAMVHLGIQTDGDYSSITGISVDVRGGRPTARVRGSSGWLAGPPREHILKRAYDPHIPWPIPHYEVQD